MPLRSRLIPYFALGLGVLSLGFSAIFVRWAHVDGPVMGVYRIGFAAMILLPAFLLNLRKNRTLRKELLIYPLLGGLVTALDHGTWNTSINLTTAANATLLNNTAPLWVALVAWLFYKERLNRTFWIGLVFALGGAAAVVGMDFIFHPTLGWGDMLALCSGIFYAGYYLATQRGRKHLDTLTYLWLVDLFSCLALLGISAGMGLQLSGFSQQTYLAFLGAALVSQIGGYLAVGYALGHLPASAVAPTMIGQPVVTALISIPLLHEMLKPAQWIGGVSVLLGIYLIHLGRSQAAEQEQAAEESPAVESRRT